jgi:ADP-heptose:LPS heptosyltransferase
VHAPDDIHEVERSLLLVQAAGYRLGPRDSGRLAVKGISRMEPVSELCAQRHRRSQRYVVVHPGASAPARRWPAEKNAALVQSLARSGRRVVVTGSSEERGLTARVAINHPLVQDLGGRLDFRDLARTIAGADAIVVGNTGPAHLAAALGTPVVSLFAPVVPAVRWRPWMVPHILLGDQQAACAGSRARFCPVRGHPCLNSVEIKQVRNAVDQLSPMPEAVMAG